MSERNDFSPELTEFEASLSSLNPAASRIDQDLLMFRLGQDSVNGRRRWHLVWPAAALAFAVLSGALGTQLAARDAVRVVYVERASSPVVEERPSPKYATAPASTDRPRVHNRRAPAEIAALDWSGIGRQGLRPIDLKRTEPRWEISSPIPLPQSPRHASPPALRVGDRQGWRDWIED
jgi:hypothetical protein